MCLIVSHKEYKKFLKSNKTDRISKGIKLNTLDNPFPLFSDEYINYEKVNEIFDRKIETDYEIEKKEYNPRNKESWKLFISFFTDSNIKYRLDIWSLVEPYEGRTNHLAFSLYENDMSNNSEYESLTNEGELHEIISRITFIIMDLLNKEIITNKFCIGGTSDIRKNKIYKYIPISLGARDIKSQKHTIYDEGWALYFTIDEQKSLEEKLEDTSIKKREHKTLPKNFQSEKLLKYLTEREDNLLSLKQNSRNNKINKLLS